MNRPDIEAGPHIHLAFRFHVNFYHSYRGDSLDERGIGKDIRVITGLLDDLDRLNAEGVPVRGTWDIENYYSLEKMMREHAPQLVSRIQARSSADRDPAMRDEIEVMSYNNGLISACIPEEFQMQCELLRTNTGGSGLDDLFDSWEPILRPQESMYTPSFLRVYPDEGIQNISLYYSAIPFNAFSTFVPPLSLVERYNPLKLVSPEVDGSMTLLPAYNHGDIADHYLSLRRWLKGMYRDLSKQDTPRDLLLIIDADADDEFWAGMRIPVLSRVVPSFDGFYRLVRSVSDLPWLQFTTPGAYLATHDTVGEISIGQDTADGSFDGYSSWAEKWENTQLWSIIQEARDYAEQASRLLRSDEHGEGRKRRSAVQKILNESCHERVLALSTTHFGMASPVMNTTRLADGMSHAERARDLAHTAWEQAGGSYNGTLRVSPSLAESEEEVNGYIRLPDVIGGGFCSVTLPPGKTSISAVGCRDVSDEVPARRDRPPVASFELSLPWISYGRGRTLSEQKYTAVAEVERRHHVSGHLAVPDCVAAGAFQRNTYEPEAGRTFLELSVKWPLTGDYGWDERKARNLDRRWDHRYREVAPVEILPSFTADVNRPFCVIKHNYFGDTSRYELNYHLFSRNATVSSINNHITNSWVAVSNGVQGILIAQHTGLDNNFAFCPMRSWIRNGRQHIALNPFGTYYGEQYRYPTAVSGLGRTLALRTADQLDSYAPSWNGRNLHIALAIFEFRGAEPSSSLQREAQLFSSRLYYR